MLQCDIRLKGIFTLCLCVGRLLGLHHLFRYSVLVLDRLWASWGEWSTCTKDCDGIQIRHRVCTGPQNGGQGCIMESKGAIDTRKCISTNNCSGSDEGGSSNGESEELESSEEEEEEDEEEEEEPSLRDLSKFPVKKL